MDTDRLRESVSEIIRVTFDEAMNVAHDADVEAPDVIFASVMGAIVQIAMPQRNAVCTRHEHTR